MPATRILNSTYDLFFEGKVQNVTIEDISAKSGVPIEELLQLYTSLDAITKALSERSLTELKARGTELAKQKGMEVLRELISNDITFFYRVEVDRAQLTEQTIAGHVSALQNFDNYFNTEMPKIYTAFFKNNRELLPSQDIDPKFFGHFISHSLKFFNFETLKAYETSSEGRKTATEQIIGSLFGKHSIDLPKF